MDDTYWHKQTSEPLFPDIEWSRPQSQAARGRLLIIGGHKDGFQATAHAFAAAGAAGAGEVKVVLPDSLARKLPHSPQMVFAPSNPGGSLGREAERDIRTYMAWSSAVLVAGDIGHNSETAILLEHLLLAAAQPIILTGDGVDLLATMSPEAWLRPNIVPLATFEQAQRLGTALGATAPLVSSMGDRELAAWLHEHGREPLVVQHNDAVFVTESGQVTSTTFAARPQASQLAASVAVSIMQHPSQILAAATTALLEAAK